MNVSKLISLNIVTNEGTLVDFQELTKQQVVIVIKVLLEVLNKREDIQDSIREYLDQSVTGTNVWKTFPDVFISQIIRKYQAKMIDDYLLNDQIECSANQ